MRSIPEPIRRLDAGAELIRTKRNGDTVWGVTVSPPSGIEQDRVYVYERRTQRARPAREADMKGTGR